MHKSWRTLLKQVAIFAALQVAPVAGVQAGDYSNVYFFGDSLSDNGAYAPVVGPNARFTNNPGTVWTDNLGASYGKTVTTAYAAWQTGGPNTAGGFALNSTGNNFAVGGARVSNTLGRITNYPGLGPYIPPVRTQITDFLSRGPVDTKALYAIVAGPNDILTQASLVRAGALASDDARTAIVTAAQDFAAQVTRLQAAGAKNLIVIGIPDIGKTPAGASLPASATALLSNLTSTYDAAQVAGLAAKNLLYFDGNKLLTSIYANPASYGFTDTLTPACGAVAALGCVATADGHMFADPVHWSTSLHQVMSDWLYSSLEGASRMGLLSQVPMGRSGAQWRSIDGRMRDFQNFGQQGQGFFVTGDYATSSISAHAGLPSADGAGRNLVMGYEKTFSDQVFGGVTMGSGRAPFDLGNNQGTVKYDELALSAFVSQKTGNFYANALTTYSWLDYESTRKVVLGPFSATERGNTRGRQSGVKGQVGYNFVSRALLHGPLIGLAWERVKIDGFSEQSNSVTAMAFGDQTRESLRSRIGWQVAAEEVWSGVKVRPYAQLTYDYEHKKDARHYSASFVGSNSALLMPTSNQTGGYGTLLTGLTAELSKALRIGIGASTTINQPGSRNSAINVTLIAPL